jgi:hypothetical protein
VAVGLGVGVEVGVGVGVGVVGSPEVAGDGVVAPLRLGAVDGTGPVGSAHPASPPNAAPADAASSARRDSMTRFFPAREIAADGSVGPAVAAAKPDLIILGALALLEQQAPGLEGGGPRVWRGR